MGTRQKRMRVAMTACTGDTGHGAAAGLGTWKSVPSQTGCILTGNRDGHQRSPSTSHGCSQPAPSQGTTRSPWTRGNADGHPYRYVTACRARQWQLASQSERSVSTLGQCEMRRMSRLLPVACSRDSSPASRQPLPGMKAGSGTGTCAHAPHGHPREGDVSDGDLQLQDTQNPQQEPGCDERPPAEMGC